MQSGNSHVLGDFMPTQRTLMSVEYVELKTFRTQVVNELGHAGSRLKTFADDKVNMSQKIEI